MTLSENGNTHDIDGSHKVNDIIQLPSEVQFGNSVAGKELVGWTTEANKEYSDDSDAPDPLYSLGADYTIASTEDKLYAVYAVVEYEKVAGTPVSFTSGGKSDLLAIDGVTSYGLGTDYGSTHAPNVVKFDNTGDYVQFALDYAPTSVSFSYKKVGGASDSKMTIQECATANGTFTDVQSFSITGAQNAIDTKTTTNSFSQKFVRMYFTKGDNVGIGNIIVTGFVKGDAVYSKYATTGTGTPEVSTSVASVKRNSPAVEGATITVTYKNVDLSKVAIALFSDPECTEAFADGWLTASLSGEDKQISFNLTENTSYVNPRNAYMKLTAPSPADGVDPAVVVIPVTQYKKAAVFTSFEDLAAAGFTSNTAVSITFADIKVVELYTNAIDLDVKDEGDNYIWIQCDGVSQEWEAGGYVHSTASVTGTWTYSSQYTAWYLSVASWDNIAYTPVYAVTFDALSNGSIKNGSATISSGDKFVAGTELTVTPDASYYISSVVVTDGTEEVTESVYLNGVITMPAYAITITATFASKPSAVDNVDASSKAVKVLKNGVLYIEKNGKTYNAQGQLVK